MVTGETPIARLKKALSPARRDAADVADRGGAASRGLIARLARAVEAAPSRWYLAASALVVCAAVLSVGWLQADEHARVLEPAHQIVFGFATLPWELDPAKPLVSFLLGVLHAPALAAARALGLNGIGEAAVLRGFTGLVCLTRLWAVALIVPLLGLSTRRRWLYTVLYATAPFTLMLMVRTSQENWSTTALLWGFYFALRALAPGDAASGARRREAVAAGAFLTLATSFRLQAGPSCLCFGVWAFFALVRRGRQGDAAGFAVGAALGLMPMALVDYWRHGQAFLPALNYLRYALADEEGAAQWGTQPWQEYLSGFLSNFSPPLSLVLLPLVALGLVLSPTLALMVVPFVAVHLALSHKEVRYMTPMIPFWTLAVFVAFERIELRRPTLVAKLPWRTLSGFAAACAAFALIASSVPLNPQPYFYDEIRRGLISGDLARTYTFVANSRSSVSQFYLGDPAFAPKTQMTVDDFSRRLAGPNRPRGDFAIQRLLIDEVPAVERTCRLLYSSIPPVHRRALEALRGIVRTRYLDALVHCD